MVRNGSTNSGFIDFYENSSNGTNKTRLIAPFTSDVTLTLPNSMVILINFSQQMEMDLSWSSIFILQPVRVLQLL